MMRRIIATLLLLLAGTVASAQVPFPQTLPANTVYGRLGISAGPGQAIPFGILANNLVSALGTTPVTKITLGVDPFTVLPNYAASNNQYLLQGVLGTSASPNASAGAAFIFQKWSTGVAATNATASFGAWKTGNAADLRVQALYAEAVDQGGWSGAGVNGFVEGIRGQATVTGANGSAYGLICVAGNATSVTYTYLVACEANTVNNSGVDAPIASAFNKNHFIAGFLATNNGTNKGDAGFIVNPFSGPLYQTGFLVAETSVSDTAFASRAATAFGLDLSLGSQSQAAILIPNNTAVRAKNAAGSQNLNILSVNTSNELVLSADTNRVLINRSFTSGVGALQLTTTQTAPNAGDTGDGVASFVYTLSAASATNELITRVFKLTATNTLTGGGAVTNARIFNLVGVSSASTTTTNMDGIYIEQAGAAGTVTTGAAIRIASWLGTTKWGIADDSGGNWYNATGSLSIGTTTVPGTAGSILASKYVQTGLTTVGALPACAAGTKGARFFVTDGNTANAFRGAVTAGGALNQWVVCDGTNWLQG